MAIEGYIQETNLNHIETTLDAIRLFGQRLKEASKQIEQLQLDMLRAVQRQQIIEEDLPPIIERHLGDVKAWLREAGHDV